MPRLYWSSDTAWIIASQEVFWYSTLKFSRLAISFIASYSQPIAWPDFGSTNCSGG
ncbi:hypothetical protein D3C85_1940950 [compost metagenome]